MAATTVNRQPSSAIVNAIVTLISNLKLADNVTPAFQRVELFDSERLAEAFEYLFITEQRVCVVVPLEEEFPTDGTQLQLMVKRRLPVAIIVSDRVLGAAQRKIALWGSTVSPDWSGPVTPGAMGLMEIVLPAVTGVLLPNPQGVLCTPVNNCVMNISDKDKADLPGRVAVALEVHCTGGTITAKIGPGNIL